MATNTKRKVAKSKTEPAAVRGARRRADGEQVVYLTAYVSTDLAKRARIRAATRGVTLSALLSDALGEHLAGAA